MQKRKVCLLVLNLIYIHACIAKMSEKVICIETYKLTGFIEIPQSEATKTNVSILMRLRKYFKSPVLFPFAVITIILLLGLLCIAYIVTQVHSSSKPYAVSSGETGVYYRSAAAIVSCNKLPPHLRIGANDSVRTYLYRIAPRNDFVKTTAPSWIFAFPRRVLRFHRDDPNYPFTCRKARKAFEDADVLVESVPRTADLTERYSVAARLQNNATLYDVLPTSTIDRIDVTLSNIFSASTSSKRNEYCNQRIDDVFRSSEWHDKSPLWISWAVQWRLKCLLDIKPRGFPSNSFVSVIIPQLLESRARKMEKQFLFAETAEEQGQYWYNSIPCEAQAHILLNKLRYWEKDSIDEPEDQLEFQLESNASETFLCGRMTQGMLDEQCARGVDLWLSGFHNNNTEQKSKDGFCLLNGLASERTKRIASRLDDMIRLQPTKSLFYLMFAESLPLDVENDYDNVSVMAYLRKLGYQVDEHYVRRNDSDEKFWF